MNVKRGMTFAAALRSFLRQDPDVIMVGEIRDLETAEIAIKAAQTGHMVLSTLHTNDASQTIARLMNMGIAPYNITSSVTLVIAQRLARRLHDCKKPLQLPAAALLSEGFTQAEIDAGMQIFDAVGCSGCNEGYKGRTGIYEVHAACRGDRQDHPLGRQRHTDRRGSTAREDPRSARLGAPQVQERLRQPRRNQPGHQGLVIMATTVATARAGIKTSVGKSRAAVSQMETFTWVGIDKRGVKIKGETVSKNASLVKASLRQQGINPQVVKAKAKPLFGKTGKTIKGRDIAVFSRQLATMMAAGVPMVQGFDIVAGGQTNPRMKDMLTDIKVNIEGGSSLARIAGEISGPVRRALLQPGQGRRIGRRARHRARHDRDVQGKHRSDQGQDQEGDVLPGGGHRGRDHRLVRSC